MAGRGWSIAALVIAGCVASDPRPGDDDGASGDSTRGEPTASGDGVSESGTGASVGVCGDGRLDPDEQCDDGNTTRGDGCHSDCTRYRLVFVTDAMQGNFGGLDGADARCTQDASAAGFTGPFVAWLSTSDVSAADRIGPSQIAFRRRDGILVAEDFDDLADGSLAAPIEMTAAGDIPAAGPVWTGTGSSGALESHACEGWSSNLPSETGRVGTTMSVDATWTDSGDQLCSLTARLYCFEG